MKVDDNKLVLVFKHPTQKKDFIEMLQDKKTPCDVSTFESNVDVIFINDVWIES